MRDKLDQLVEYLKLQERIFDNHDVEAVVLADGSIVVDIINNYGDSFVGERTVIESDGTDLYAVYHTGEHEKLSELMVELEKKLEDIKQPMRRI